MVLFLMFDISFYYIYKVFAYCESAIGPLPFKEFTRSDLMCDEMGGSSFDLLYQVCHSDCGWKAYEEMDMIRSAA